MNDFPFVYQASKPIAGVRPLFVLPSQSSASFFDAHGGAPEASLIEWAEKLMPNKELFLDVGAHVGTWGITFAMKGHPVFCFEPQPWLARLCNAGFVLNGLSPQCAPLGLSDKQATMELAAPYTDGGGGSIVCQFEQDVPIRMDVIPLDRVDIKGGRLGMIKMDAEGAELDVLRGGVGIIQEHHPKILLECWEDERGQRKEELFRYLHDELRYETSKTPWPEMWLAEYR